MNIVAMSKRSRTARCSVRSFPLYAQEKPLAQPDSTKKIIQVAEEEQLEEVVIQSTRTSRTINNVPTRVEIIDGEEVEEKANMRPANVAMILHESTGI